MKIKMTRRLLDKNAVKIYCNESPEEQDFHNNLDLNFSSDEDIFLKGKSEILWSRAIDLFDSSDSYQSFSDFTGRTLSSCSWHNDEFDMKSSTKVNASLEAIDNALYEKAKSSLLSDIVFQECCDWAENFPYFRIKGKQIISPGIENFLSYSTNSSNIKHFELQYSTSSLHLEGKQLPIHTTNKCKGITADNTIDNNVLTSLERIIDDGDDKYEEYFAVHKSDQANKNMELPINEHFQVHHTLKILQENVIDQLVSEIWPNVITFLENLDKNLLSISGDLQLPPITAANKQKKALHLKRPKTEGSSIVCTEFPKLESILTVSPKVLQKRELSCISRVARPNSEMSVNSHVASKSVYQHANSSQITSESRFLKSVKTDRGNENLYLSLPALEEGFQDSASVLRGFHIQPGRKDVSNKTVQSSRNEYDILNTSGENDYFLPPIEDKNHVPTNLKLTKSLFTFYESPIMQDISSRKYKETNSRPNTSVPKQTIKSHEVTHQVPVHSKLYISSRGMSKTSTNMHTKKNIEVSIVGTETVEESQRKLVTLFPIVTSLTPHEDKNNSSVKKGQCPGN